MVKHMNAGFQILALQLNIQPLSGYLTSPKFSFHYCNVGMLLFELLYRMLVGMK